MASHLDEKQRKTAMNIGYIGAYGFRIVALLTASTSGDKKLQGAIAAGDGRTCRSAMWYAAHAPSGGRVRASRHFVVAAVAGVGNEASNTAQRRRRRVANGVVAEQHTAGFAPVQTARDRLRGALLRRTSGPGIDLGAVFDACQLRQRCGDSGEITRADAANRRGLRLAIACNGRLARAVLFDGGERTTGDDVRGDGVGLGGRGVGSLRDGATLHDRGTNALLHEVVGLLLFQVTLDAIHLIRVNGAHVIPDVGDAERLEKSHDCLRLQIQLLRNFVNAHLAHRTSGDLHA